MANVKFDNVELSSLGLAVRTINGRGIASWRPEAVEILGRDSIADLSGKYSPQTQTTLAGTLSADTGTWANHTHAKLQERLDALKALLDPEGGYKKLLVTGDRSDVFRWCRLSEMDYQEQAPIFKLPFNPIGLSFDNLEPFWRKPHAVVSQDDVADFTIPNSGKKTRPIVELTITGPVNASLSGTVITPVDLLVIDNLTVRWKGLDGDGGLVEGEHLIIDCDAMTVIVTTPTGGDVDPPPRDALRYYDYTGPGAFDNAGFPIIAAGGSTVSAKHDNVSTVAFSYDERKL